MNIAEKLQGRPAEDTNLVQLALFGTSLIGYYIFHTYDPALPKQHVALLIGIPAVLSLVLYQLQSHFLRSVGTAFGGYWALLLLFTGLYRVSPFHRLASFPGPLHAKLSKVWMTFIMSQGKIGVYYRDLHRQYGDIVRVGPNELSICHPDVIQAVLGSKGLRKGPFYSGRQLPNGLTSLLNVADPVEHAGRRRTWNRGMSSAALKDYEHIVRNKVQELMDGLAQRVSQELDISQWMSFFGFDFMGEMAFGTDFGMLKAGSDPKGIWHLLDKGIFIIQIFSFLPWLGRWVQMIPQKANPVLMLRKMAADNITRRASQGSHHRDLFHYLLDEDGLDASKPSLPVALSDGVLAVVAGSDTTSTALSHMWYFLLRYPDVYKRLREEVDSTFPPGDDPMNFSRHVDMPYLNACINETLRVLPPVQSGNQRTTLEEASIVGPFVVPPYTAVSVNTYGLHRDPRAFAPLPETFWPERWLEQDKYTLPNGEIISAEQLVLNRNAYIPFSFGPANCVGKNLALMEVRAVTAVFVSRFEMTLGKGFDLDLWEANLKDYGVTLRGELMVNLKARHK